MGPLYPLSVAAILEVLPTTYYSIKLTAVLWSLAGLGALFFLCRRLQGPGFAALATVVAGTGSWLLAYSRLGDVEAAVPFIAMAALALAARIVETRPTNVAPALLCGVVTGASFYVYGGAFAVPLLVTAVLVGSWLSMPKPRFAMRHLWIYAGALVVTLVPLIASFRSKDDVTNSHFATRMVRDHLLTSVLGHFQTALGAYVIQGDPISRGNPQSLPHVDRVGLALAIVGCVYWLMPGRRRWGAALIGGFLLMHLPTALASEGAINAARTIAAAPFLYILVASGLWAIATFLRRRLGTTVAVSVAGVLLAVMIGINLDRYFRLYPRGLPYGNTPIARAITEYVDMLPAETNVHLVGSTWTEAMPEPKSIWYTMRHPESFHEENAAMDCDRLGRITPPAVLIWTPGEPLPNRSLSRCAAHLTPQLYSSPNGLPLFQAAPLVALASRPMKAEEGAPAEPTTVTVEGEPAQLQRGSVVIGGKVVEFLHQPLDIGQPRDTVDGDLSTLMRAAGDNPYHFELHYAEPTRIAGFRLSIGFIPDYQIEVTVHGADGRDTKFARRDRPSPGMPQIDLTVPEGPVVATSVAFAINDLRPRPLEGWHFHLFELEQR